MKIKLKIGLWLGVIVAAILLGMQLKNKGLVTLRIGRNALIVEVKDTPEGLGRGLMYRKKLPENRGMLFIFEEPGIYPFWMKNTYIPLSIAFISVDDKIIQIDNMFPLDTVNLHFPKRP
ncbi:MAG: DUF192 domain-containing protein, partial [Candidatus Stahlbacteria bacterium]|nr:DUF192 domain-containing protein [Candidatus Stahlbacteria bacterium]